MEKEAKVTKVQGDGMFNDLYKFELELDNGDSGKVYKKLDNAGVQIGETITYTQNDKGTIKVQTGYQKRFPEKFKDKGYDKRTQRYIIRQSSLKTATDFIINTKGDESDLFLLADKMVAYCMGGNTDFENDKKQEKEENDVPF
jgi:hypothetical protein